MSDTMIDDINDELSNARQEQMQELATTIMMSEWTEEELGEIVVRRMNKALLEAYNSGFLDGQAVEREESEKMSLKTETEEDSDQDFKFKVGDLVCFTMSGITCVGEVTSREKFKHNRYIVSGRFHVCEEKLWLHFSPEPETEEEPKPEFKAGDRVRIKTHEKCRFNGRCGVVQGRNNITYNYNVALIGDLQSDDTWPFDSGELELEPPASEPAWEPKPGEEVCVTGILCPNDECNLSLLGLGYRLVKLPDSYKAERVYIQKSSLTKKQVEVK